MSFSFSKKLLEWYEPTTRNLPWKQTNDAYKIWLSEIILQQTRVEQGTPYYLAFVKKYPTIQKLAAAPLDDVLKLWEGLGYYSRARNLHTAAQQVVALNKGKVPTTYEHILALKGIGSYTAAAIASFAYNLPHAVLDGNVFRVLARVFGVETPIDSTEGKKQFTVLAEKLLDKKNPAAYNQAIMDFGALVCKPQNPLCGQCPFSSDCKALEQNKIQQLPVKGKKLIRKERHFHYFVVFDQQFIYLRQRTEQDIWKGLFEFPMVETPTAARTKNDAVPIDASLLPAKITPAKQVYRQILSHQFINGYFHEIPVKKLPKPDKAYVKIAKAALADYAFPKIVRSYLQDRLNFLT